MAPPFSPTLIALLLADPCNLQEIHVVQIFNHTVRLLLSQETMNTAVDGLFTEIWETLCCDMSVAFFLKMEQRVCSHYRKLECCVPLSNLLVVNKVVAACGTSDSAAGLHSQNFKE